MGRGVDTIGLDDSTFLEVDMRVRLVAMTLACSFGPARVNLPAAPPELSGVAADAPGAAADAAPAPTAADLLDRYDRSMAALANARVAFVVREELACSWKPSQWKLEENAVERDARGRMKFVWRRMITPARIERLVPE
jgi:hypothetical protein